MEFAKGLATGFVVGVALIGAVVALLYGRDDAARERNLARIAELESQVGRLEEALEKSSLRPPGEMPASRSATTQGSCSWSCLEMSPRDQRLVRGDLRAP